MLYKLWNDCDGGIITTELVLVASVLTATLLTGLGSFRNHIQTEFEALGNNLQQAKVSNTISTAAANSDADEPTQIPGTVFAGNLDEFLGH